MEVDWVTILQNFGFMTLFCVFTLSVFWKITNDFGPKALAAWTKFTDTLHDLAETVRQNSEITQQQYNESVSVKEQLRHLNDRLNSRDAVFAQNREDHIEMLRILHEMEVTIKRLDDRR